MPSAQVIELADRRAPPGNTQTLERALIRRAARGDREAFRRIVEGHRSAMFKVAYGVLQDRALAEDVVQEAFIKAYRALDGFRADAAQISAVYLRR